MARWALAAAGFGLALWAGPQIMRAISPAPELELRPTPGVPGFRFADLGGVSVGFDPLAGAGARAPRPLVDVATLCAALADEGPGVAVGPKTAPPVAVISDYRCTFCRVLSSVLLGMADDGAARVIHHEWPILGPASEQAARLALAAAAQGGYAPMHRRLMRTAFVVDDAYAAAAGRDLGFDVDALRAAMAGEETEAALRRSAMIAEALGLAGTPAVVVGAIVLAGRVDRATIEAALRIEAARATPVCPAPLQR